MSFRPLIYVSVAISLLVTNGGAQYAKEKADFGSFSAGQSKGQMHTYKMDSPWPITQALAIAWSFRFEGSVCVLVRDGRVFLLGDETNAARIDDLPVKPGDCFHRYSEEDVKAWNLPVYQEADTIRILKEEAERDKARSKSVGEPTRRDGAKSETIKKGPSPPDAAAPRPATSSVNPKPDVPVQMATPERGVVFWLALGLVTIAVSGLLWGKLKRRNDG